MPDLARDQFQRAVARVAPVVEEVLGDFAATYALAAIQRRDAAPIVVWSIDNAPIVEFEYHESGASDIRVYDISLVALLRKRLRSKRVHIEHALDEP